MRFLLSFFIIGLILQAPVLGQTQQKKGIEIRKSPYKIINDTPYVRIQEYRNDTLIQELYCFAVPTCRISYGIKKWEWFKKYEAIDVLVPHGRYYQYQGASNRLRVFDRGVLMSETFNGTGSNTADTGCCKTLKDISVYEYHRKCNKNEKRYRPVVYN